MPLVIVDGYNMIRRLPRFSRAEGRGLERGRDVLLFELEEYSGLTGVQILTVFDGAGRPRLETGDLSSRESFAGVDIMFSERGKSADQLIMEVVKKLRKDGRYEGLIENCYDPIVVTDDMAIRDEAIYLGAYVMSTGGFDKAMREKSHLYY